MLFKQTGDAHMTTSYRSVSRTALIAVLAIIFAACSALAPGPDNTVNELMPKPAGYNYTDLAKYQGELITLLSAGGAATGQLQVVAAAQVIGGLANCYKDAGAYAAGGYNNPSNLLENGIVVLINKTVVTNPMTLVNCVNQARQGPNAAQQDNIISPCAKVHEFKYNGKDIMAIIAGTDSPFCTNMCNALPDAGVCLAK
jgi:hypothetical protein